MDNPLIDTSLEQSAIGVMLYNDRTPTTAVADYGIKPEMFGEPVHQTLVREIFAMADERKGYVDGMLLNSRLKASGIISQLPSDMYLMQCHELTPLSMYAGEYFERIRQLWERRMVVKTCQDIMSDAYEQSSEDGFLGAIPQRFHDLMPTRTAKRTNRDCLESSYAMWCGVENGELEMPGLSTGYAKLDEILGGGLQPGFHVIGARPSAGKTSLEGCIMTYLAKNKIPVGRVCMDMDMQQLLNRDACREAGVSLPKLNMGYAGKKNLAEIEEAKEEICEWPMHVLEEEYDIDNICSWARLMKLRHDIQCLSVDYIQLCQAPGSKIYMSDVQRIGHCSQRLKALGQELKIPILVLAQLNRDSSKEGRKPTLADLKGCGDLEQHAQTCILLSKEPKFDYDRHGIDEVTKRAIWCDVAKNQQGGIGLNEMWFKTSYFNMDFAPETWGVVDWKIER